MRAALSAALAAACALSAGCVRSLELVPSDAPTVLARHALDEENPARPGPHEVLTLYYGSGTDKNRPEYRDSVAIATAPVDASKLVDLGESAKSRNDYWGFSPDSFPINGRVWYPAGRGHVGSGPHPLVLVVHGNHNMREFSDPGYDWLGELLASRGYVLASVDMNFVNGGIRGENDARGWLLLKHLQAWKRFNEDPESPFHRRVDLDAVGLIGHSRGGEAVAVAAAFNRLTRYPDDASLEFDFGFGIKAVVAIAPVDGQYLPADQRASVEDVNYLVFHGSHDGDVTSFHGLRQFNRVRFGASATGRFKSAIYVYRANHGQWNTVWGAHDNGPRSSRILDLRGLLPPEDQREFGRVFVSAFLDVSLMGDDRYRPLFRDHRVAGGWLPKTMYVTRFMDDSFRPFADFEEDIDVTTGSAPGVRLDGRDLGTWREGRLELRSSNRTNTSSSQLNQALWLGWNNEWEGGDSEGAGSGGRGSDMAKPTSPTPEGPRSSKAVPPAAFTVSLPAGLAEAWETGPASTLEMHVGGLDEEPAPRERPRADDGDAAEPSEFDRPDADRTGDDASDDDASEKPPLDLTVEAEDADGDAASVRLGDYGPLRRPLKMRVYRRRDVEETRFASRWELILQHFSIPLSDFADRNPAFDPRTLRVARLVFDQTPAGTVVVDDMGLSRLHPAFLEARVPQAR